MTDKKTTQPEVFPSNPRAKAYWQEAPNVQAKWAAMKFKLKARISSSNPRAIRPALEGLVTRGSVTKVGDEFIVEAEMEGTSAKELNRTLLSALRRAEKKTRLRAEWTSSDNTAERFFDYVLKKIMKN